MTSALKVVYLSGGVGGARLLRGLAAELAADALTAVVNTGDDFEHWGLWICPDLDTVMYTLSGLAHPTRGWGLAEESFHAAERIARLGGETWFSLSDQDLATHLMRSQWLRAGHSLTEVTARLCRALGVVHAVLPMCDAPVATVIETRAGEALPFQTWFVQRRAEPPVRAVRFEGEAQANPAVLSAIAGCDAVLIGPSNPYVSIDPILSLPGMRDALARKPTYAVSPIIGGQAVKGPLASMIVQLTGQAASASAIARHYLPAPGLAGIVVQAGEQDTVRETLDRIRVLGTETWMRAPEDSRALARACLSFMAEQET